MRYEQTAAAAAAAAAVAKQQAGASTHHAEQSSASAYECRPVIESSSPLHTAPLSLATATGPGPRGLNVDEELRDAFQVFDKDKDGFLSAADLRSV